MTARILVADDSATMRMIVQAALTRAGWQVVTASDGKQALELAQAQAVDLVVSDWNMPVMGGLDLIRGLRGQARYQDLPVLVLTTEDDGDSKAAARDLGVCGWLNKPLDPDVLVDLAAELLGVAPGA
ncbi:response regulator receiver domain protein [Bordetella bronchiseptica E014]|uniref:response regulator n=1 Tax=Bordetella bronchiseptica TaxID=518 RepID=UPI00049F04C3|nr:response regulator [Bordetella bronchiseptica]KDC23524.1 response regulator receiver domain protein [Bordetella bronchiseptica E014]QIX98843.1 response regulator [Bordetella bronchiseptica]